MKRRNRRLRGLEQEIRDHIDASWVGLARRSVARDEHALYEVDVYDLPTLLPVAVVLALGTSFASSVPILRARIDPALSLRGE
jgi:hypothetical protein